MVRSSILADFPACAARHGIAPLELLKAAGLPARCLTQPELLVRAGRVHRLLELAAARSAAPDFGLQMSRSRRLVGLGLVGALMRDEPTVREALHRFIATAHLNSSAIWLQLREEAGWALLQLHLDSDGQPVIRQATELALGGLVSVLRQLLPATWHPQEVHFAHGPAQPAAQAARFFGCSVRFDAEVDAILLRSQDLDHRVPLADGGLTRYAGLAALASLARQEAVTVNRVKQRILLQMMDGPCSATDVAASLGVDRRTLHRRLAREDSSFLAVYDTVRLELAKRHLRAGWLSMAQVAQTLNIDSPSAFSRWFKRHTGETPSRWRDQHRAAPGTR